MHEEACKQWSGWLDDFYKPRWEQFFNEADQALQNGNDMPMAAFTNKIKDWEWQWVNERKDYPTTPGGDPAAISEKMYDKYYALVSATF